MVSFSLRKRNSLSPRRNSPKSVRSPRRANKNLRAIVRAKIIGKNWVSRARRAINQKPKLNNKVTIVLIGTFGNRKRKTVRRNEVNLVTNGYNKINGYRINGQQAYRQKNYTMASPRYR